MIIGETLTQARDRVGLSVTDVSERTRIRETIIRDIEQNEFRSSGGDFYARGHIRAIARVVGADPAPLIEAYDQTHEWSLKQEILRQGILGEDGSLLHPARDAEDEDADDFGDDLGPAGFEDPADAWDASDWPADAADPTTPGVVISDYASPADEPSTVDDLTAVDEPTTVDDLTAVDEPIAADNRNAAHNPAAVDNPSAVPDPSTASVPTAAKPDFVLDDLWAADDPAAATQQVPVYRLGSAQVPPRPRAPEVSGRTDQVRSPGERTMRLPEIHLPAEGIAAFRERLVAVLAVGVEALRGAWERLRAQAGRSAARPGAWERLRAQDGPSTERPGAWERLRAQGATSTERSQRAARGAIDRLSAWATTLRGREGRPGNVTAILALALLAAIGAIAYLLAASPATPARPASVASSPRASAPAHSAPAHRAGGHNPTHPAARPSAGTAVTQAGPLQPAAAIAFGPGGASQGDNPQLASQALADKSNDAWHTSWYTTSHFGGLQKGTGLLLDMGKSVTITSAQLTLGIERGANVQLLAGNQPQMADLHPIAAASDAGGGSVVLRPAHPAQARYLLIWFTQLPPNRTGTYEAWISHVAVKGVS